MSLPISSVSRGRCKTLPKTAQIALISAFFVFLELDSNYTGFKQYSLHNLYLQSDTISVFILYLCTCITGSLQGMLNTPFSGKAKQGLLTAMLWDYPLPAVIYFSLRLSCSCSPGFSTAHCFLSASCVCQTSKKKRVLLLKNRWETAHKQSS